MATQGNDHDNARGSDAPAAHAEVAVLRELLAVAAHDLSNPLQSLSVLLELTLDELPEGSAAETKIESSLTAAEQLRVLIRGIAEFARPPGRNRRTLGRTVDACVGVCIRRFERQRIEFARDTESIDGFAPVPAELRVAILAVCLGCVHAAGQSGLANHRLQLVGERQGDDDQGALVFGFVGEGDDGSSNPLAIDERYIERARDAIGGVGGSIDASLGGEVRITVSTIPSDPAAGSPNLG